MSQFAVGEVLAGKYEIKAVLGAGGMGTVYRARQIDLGRDVAIKVPLPAALEVPGFLVRFSREAKLVAKLVHDNIVQVYEYQESADSVYIVMEYVEGQDMKTIVTRPPTGLTVKDFATMLRASLEGLGHAHEFGIVHRDIKPHNIMVQQRAKGKWRVKIMDFGIAHLEENANLTMNDQQLTATGQAIGTPSYMSPEQIRGMGISGASDIYSFGCVIFYVFTRQTPFSGTGFTIAAAHLSEAPPPLRARVPMLPEAAEKLVYKCLEKDPARRPQEASELGQEIYEALQPIFDVPMAKIWPQPREQQAGTEALRPTAPLGDTQSRSDPTIASQLDAGPKDSQRLTDPAAATISEGPIPGYKDPAPAAAAPQATGFTGGTQTSPSQLSEPTIPYEEREKAAAARPAPAPAVPATISPQKAIIIGAAVVVPVALVGAVIAMVASGKKTGEPEPSPTPTVVVDAQPTPAPSPTPTPVPPTPAPGDQPPTPGPTEAPARPTAVPTAPPPTPDPVLARVETLRSFFSPTASLADRVRVWEDAWRDRQHGADPRIVALADDLALQIARAPEMAAIERGAFTMGAPAGVGSADESPQHNVRLSAYEIGINEVTALEFSTFLNTMEKAAATRLYVPGGRNNIEYDDARQRFAPVEGRALHPANGVSWDAAKAYAEWLSTETKQRFRLPTEAEWENAARTQSGQLYPWGSADPDMNRAQFNSDGTVAVTEKSAGRTPSGLRHMAGNVAEWCLDWYAAETYEKNMKDGAENPRGPDIQAGGRGARKVLRGGSFEAQNAQDLRLTRRERLEPDKRNADVGFRLVREVR